MVSSVVSVIGSVNLTIYTLYGYNKDLTGMTPRNSIDIPDNEVSKMKQLPQLGKLFRTHSYQVEVKTIFGKMPFPLFGLPPAGRELLMKRTGVTLAAGRMCESGKPEAVLSNAVARNLGVKIGDVLLDPNSLDRYAPIPVKLVGLLKGPVWLGLTSRSLVDNNSPLTFSGYLAFSPTASQAQQRALDNALEHTMDKSVVRVWRYAGLVKQTHSALSNLYLILNIVVALISIGIALVCGLLSNIYFSQRLPEIATLWAIGYTRTSLLIRSLGEIAILCILGWITGIGSSIALLKVLYLTVLKPKGLLLDPVDPHAFLLTTQMPVVILLFALATLWFRLTTLDPVSIIERRG